MRWSASTVISSVLISLLPQAAFAADAAVDAANASISAMSTNATASESANRIYYDKVQPGYGSGAAMNDTALKPMTNAAPLKDLNGKTLGNVSMMTPSDKPLMSVAIYPDFANGEVQKIVIAQDLDADGTMDYSATIGGGSGGQIVGMCSNGLVLCPTGTYGTPACVYERWDTDGNGGMTVSSRLTGVPNTSVELFNCYCFSNHCSRFNNSAVQNIGKITQDFGGNILAKFMESRPDLVVSSVKVTDTIATYYGTSTGKVSQADGFTAPRKANRDYSNLPVITSNTPDATMAIYPNIGALDAAAATENATMATTPNSLYSIVNSLEKNTGSVTTKCVNRRSGGVNSVTQSASNSMSRQVCTDHIMWFRLSSTDAKTFQVEFEGTGPGGDANIGSDIGHNCGGAYGGPIQVGYVIPPTGVDIIGMAASSAGYSCYYTEGSGNGVGTGQWFPTNPLSMPWATGSTFYGSKGAQWPTVNCTTTAEYMVESYTENVSNACSAYEGDSACRLMEDKWDGRPAVTNFLPTGFQMAQICQDYPGQLRNYRVCKPWMKQERVYVCDRNDSVNFDSYLQSIRSKMKGIQDDAKSPGNVPADSCEKACKVKVARVDTLVRTGGVDSDVKREGAVTQSQFDYFVKTCALTTGSPVCPVDASKGETIVTDCSCLNEYGEALAQSEALQKAANDVTCSRKPASELTTY